jgi:hypothetical protein
MAHAIDVFGIEILLRVKMCLFIELTPVPFLIEFAVRSKTLQHFLEVLGMVLARGIDSSARN